MDFGKCPRCGLVLSKSKGMRAEAQDEYPNAFRPWTQTENETLRRMYCEEGRDFIQIGVALGRQPSAIRARVDKLVLFHAPVAAAPSGPAPVVHEPSSTEPL